MLVVVVWMGKGASISSRTRPVEDHRDVTRLARLPVQKARLYSKYLGSYGAVQSTYSVPSVHPTGYSRYAQYPSASE